jgi:hypothetical protein
MGEPQDLADRVRALVAQERAMPHSKVHLTSRLEEDLGMTGDDAAGFLEAFAAQLHVDLSGIDFHRHFGPEGCNPFWLLYTPAWLKGHGRYPVTVDHLVRVAEVGRWFSPPRVGRADDA